MAAWWNPFLDWCEMSDVTDIIPAPLLFSLLIMMSIFFKNVKRKQCMDTVLVPHLHAEPVPSTSSFWLSTPYLIIEEYSNSIFYRFLTFAPSKTHTIRNALYRRSNSPQESLLFWPGITVHPHLDG